MYKVPQKKAPLREKQAKRLSPTEYADYQDWIMSKGICQVCEISADLDAPHHTKQGLGVKDDRSLICICIACHREIHTQGFSKLNKSREELEKIGEDNWSNYSS